MTPVKATVSLICMRNFGPCQSLKMLPEVSAVTDLAPAETGVSKAHFMLCNDGNKYLVKFVRQDPEPHLRRTVVNELIAGALANRLGLPCPRSVLVKITQEFIDNSVELREAGVTAGYHNGSKVVTGRSFLQFGPDFARGKRLTNVEDLYGVIVFDNLVLNSDRDNAGNNMIDILSNNEVYYRMIDFGHCFTGADWTIERLTNMREDSQIMPCFWYIRENTADNMQFEPWFSRVEGIPDEGIELILQDIPSGWGITAEERFALKELVNSRKNRVRWYVSASRGIMS